MARTDELSGARSFARMNWRGLGKETILGKITVGSSPAGYPGINVSQIGKRESPIWALLAAWSWSQATRRNGQSGAEWSRRDLVDTGNTATKVVKQHPGEVQLFNTFRTTDEYKEDWLCDQVDRLSGRNSPSRCSNDYWVEIYGQHTRSQETVERWFSCQHETKWNAVNTAWRCPEGRLSRVPGEIDPENGRFELVRRHKTTGEENAVYEVRATRWAYTSKTRSKEVRSARKGSKASSSYSNQLRTQHTRRWRISSNQRQAKPRILESAATWWQAAISGQAQEIRSSPEWSGVASSSLHDDVQRPGSGNRNVFSKGHDCRRVAQAT